MKKTKTGTRKTRPRQAAARPNEKRKSAPPPNEQRKRKKRAPAAAEPEVRRAIPVEIVPAAVPVAMRLLRLNRQGDDVARWQQFLLDHGFNPGAVDGFFGGATRLATIAFQKQHNLIADGVVGGRTRAAAASTGLVVSAPVDLALHGIVHDEDDVIGRIQQVTIFETRDGAAVYFKTGMNIDADGAYRAYRIRDLGLDYDDNGKDPCAPSGRWIGVVTDSAGKPIPQQAQHPAPGYLISTTSLQDPTRAVTDPFRYVDSESIPYIVLPGGHLGRASLGDYALIVNTETKSLVHAIAADAGPKNKIGEASIAAARALLGEKAADPRRGGTERPIIRYIVFPNSKDHIFPASDPHKPALLEQTLRHINANAASLFAALAPAHQAALMA